MCMHLNFSQNQNKTIGEGKARQEAMMDINSAHFKILIRNVLFKCLMTKEVHSIRLSDLKDAYNAL